MDNSPRIQEALDKHNLDAVLLVSPANTFYAGGVDVLTSKLVVTKPTFVIVPRSGESTVVVVEWDTDATREQSHLKDVRSYPANEATPAVVEVLREKGLANGVLGIEEHALLTAHYKQLQAALPQAHFMPCDQLMQEVRLVKTPREIEVMRRAAVSTEKAIVATFATARVGDTERELADRIVQYLRQFGAETPIIPMLSAGVNSTVVHLLPTHKPIAPGEIIHVDTFEPFGGYWSDISRNASVGKPSEKQHSTYKRLWEIQQRLIDEVRVGTRVSDLFRRYVALSEEQGLPAPLATLGHGIGLELHELPEIDLEHDLELVPGMVLSIEPTTIIPGDARYDIEDTVLVTEDGPELLSGWYSTEEMIIIE